MSKNTYKYPLLFYLVFALNFTFLTSFASLNILPAYLSSLGAGNGYIGFFMNVGSLEMVLFILIFGKYTNKFNKKRAMILGNIIFFISMIFMFFFHNNLYLLLFLRIISCICYIFCSTMHINMLNDIIPKEKRTSSLAIIGISGILTSPIGSYLGEKVILFFEPKYLFILSLFFCLTSIFIIFFMNEPKSIHTGKENKSFWMIIKNKNMIHLFITSFIFGGTYAVFASFIPVFSKERLGEANLSNFFIPYALIGILIRLFFSNAMDRISKYKLIVFSLFSIFSSLVLICFLNSMIVLIITGLLFGIGQAIMFPVLSSAFIESGHEKDRSILFNTYVTFSTFGSVFISTVLGFSGDIFGILSIYIIMFLLVLGNLFYILINKRNSIQQIIKTKFKSSNS